MHVHRGHARPSPPVWPRSRFRLYGLAHGGRRPGSCSPVAGAAGWASTRRRSCSTARRSRGAAAGRLARGVRPGARGRRRRERAAVACASSPPGAGPLAALAAAGACAARPRATTVPRCSSPSTSRRSTSRVLRLAARPAGRAHRRAPRSTAGSSRCAPATAPTRCSRPQSLRRRRRPRRSTSCSTWSTTTWSTRPSGARSPTPDTFLDVDTPDRRRAVRDRPPGVSVKR